ncbi:DUF1566 domain-containing protein [Legionella taurinensis]|uniref:DUF1566 domain-containing protein n=1 Tax=Legionella taurinensis TaxID=70611 RepID=A0A3A5L2W2_9GAMM|nr:DUF1566 domain-containing protein [Legionella taurinensis]MDX1836361.1 DUF1566 domain-containing protein [Legionella taurinensis]PUT41891.1 hypothetical protein DB744_01990 [Legionella taurinensis]PUT44680.1 hypothetical protein DB746_01990 [Legionella taurinensis]PUT48000.1 hypothetical protein DB743_00150 [Legionella taurinensis]PUT48813.1 hypothetical protein DB745_01990 [Legionella taurinensis]
MKGTSQITLSVCFIALLNLPAFASNPDETLHYGRAYEGGVVACLQSNGDLYNLIAANKDNSDGISWGGQGIAIGPSAQSETDGLANSQAIREKLGDDSSYAAKLCLDYEVDAAGNTPCKDDKPCYRDWFLPAKKQLHCLYKHHKEIGGFAKDYYWSSSEFAGYPEYSAWDLYFSDQAHHDSGEDDFERVRCVRYFTPPKS